MLSFPSLVARLTKAGDDDHFRDPISARVGTQGPRRDLVLLVVFRVTDPPFSSSGLASPIHHCQEQ